MNRKSVLLATLPIVMGEGRRCAWDVSAPNAQAAVYAEAADVAGGDYGADDELPATLNWGLYRAPFAVTGLAEAATASTLEPRGLSGMGTYWREKLFGAVSKLGAVINVDLWSGATANGILGCYAAAGALLATGVYAGIDRAAATYWQANVLANGGVPRPISFPIMRDAIRSIYVAAGESPDLIITDPIQFDKFAALFDPNRRWTLDVIETAAGRITLAGGQRALEFDGIPVLRDKDHPTGTMSFLNSNYMNIKFLPTRDNQFVDDTAPTERFMVHDEKGNISGLPLQIELLGKTGDATKSFVKVYVQLVNRRPNASAQLADLA